MIGVTVGLYRNRLIQEHYRTAREDGWGMGCGEPAGPLGINIDPLSLLADELEKPDLGIYWDAGLGGVELPTYL